VSRGATLKRTLIRPCRDDPLGAGLVAEDAAAGLGLAVERDGPDGGLGLFLEAILARLGPAPVDAEEPAGGLVYLLELLKVIEDVRVLVTKGQGAR